jgi:plasmid stabilization system protein ParE
MIASRAPARPLPRVIWRQAAKHSLNTLMDFLEGHAGVDSKFQRAKIEDAIESLRHSPLRCMVTGTRDGLTYRRLVVDGRFFVYYIYTPARRMNSGGTISIRAVRHAASQYPFLGVREARSSEEPLAALTTRPRPEPATA